MATKPKKKVTAKKVKGKAPAAKGPQAAPATKAKGKKKRDPNLPVIKCRICGHEARCLTSHLTNEHKMTATQYQAEHPGAPIFTDDLLASFKDQGGSGSSNNWNGMMKLLKLLVLKLVAQIKQNDAVLKNYGIFGRKLMKGQYKETFKILNQGEAFRNHASRTAF